MGMRRIFKVRYSLILFLMLSCKTERRKLPIEHCDELNIVYYGKNPFVFKSFDPSTINFYTELLTYENETLSDTCETTGKLIFKNKGKEIIIAQVSTINVKDSISCDYVTFLFDSKLYRHRLTYQTGMGIDGIYWHKVDPKANPWNGVDSSKFRYEELNRVR
jgi:hypothetical protein